VSDRKTLSKKLRFEVFKRDDFTCQYCGVQPPKVVLEVDHIHPVAEGGTDDQENLITACDKCNRGKGKRMLGDKIIRPDADLMWLQTQQEIAELKRFQKAKKQREKVIAETIQGLQDYWFAISSLDWCPSYEVCRRLLVSNSPEVIEYAFSVVTPKIESGQLRGADEWRPYMYSVCRNKRNDSHPWVERMEELRGKVESLEAEKQMYRAFLALVLDAGDWTVDGVCGPLEFDQQTYAVLHNELLQESTMVEWRSTDEGKTWKLWVKHNG